MRRVVLLIGLLGVALFLFIKPPMLSKASRESNVVELAAPAGDQPTYINRTGETVLPNGRLITPEGVQVTVEPHPYGMALSPGGNLLVTANIGTWPFSLSIISALASNLPRSGRSLPATPQAFRSGALQRLYGPCHRPAITGRLMSRKVIPVRLMSYDLQIGQRSQVISLDRRV